MSDQDILHKVTDLVKASYPQLSAEAIVGFMVVAGNAGSNQTVGDVARIIGLAEPVAYQHLSTMTPGKGSGLLSFVNLGDGRNQVQLTPKGATLRDEINLALST